MNRLNLHNDKRGERKNIYRIPDGFFSTLEENILRATVEKQGNVPSHPKRWMKWAVAAAVVVMLCFSGIGALRNKPDFNNDRGLAIHNLFYSDL